MSVKTFERLTALLDNIWHAIAWLSIRLQGNLRKWLKPWYRIRQGAKALVCKVKGNGVKQAVLVILPADQQSDLSKVAAYLGG